MAAALGCASASGYWAQSRDYDLSRKILRNHNNNNRKGFRVACISSTAVFDSYKTLRIQPGASESEVKKAFRQLALQVLFSFSPDNFFQLIGYLFWVILFLSKIHGSTFLSFFSIFFFSF